MDIIFNNSKLRRLCCDSNLAEQKLPKDRARLLRRRLDELRDAEALEVMRSIPQAHCEELKGNRKGQLSVRLDGLWRLVFEPADEPFPKKADGGLDWHRVRCIRILEVIDYHDWS